MNEQTKKLYFVIDMAYKKIYIVAVLEFLNYWTVLSAVIVQ